MTVKKTFNDEIETKTMKLKEQNKGEIEKRIRRLN